MIKYLKQRFTNASSDVRRFLTAIAIASFSGSIVEAVFNNFLNETFTVSSLTRTLIEIPRETPGLLVMFFSALLFFLCNRRLAAFALALCSVGLTLLATHSTSLLLVLVWLFVYSTGQHLMIPLQSGIGMELAREGQDGRRLGQINAIRNLCAIGGAFFVFVGFRWLHLNFSYAFLTASAGFLCGSIMLYRMKASRPHPPSMHLKLHKKYRLFYWLSILFGTRKQIFLTFAPWVLVKVFAQPVQNIAILMTVGGILGIILQPLLGRLIDTKGERFVLAGEALLLIFVCLLYGFAGKLFPSSIALLVTGGCYIADQLLMSVGMARATYLKKIALAPEHIMPALTASTSMDHVFSISTAIFCGCIWQKFGYQYVFLIGAAVACVNLVSALQIRIPVKTAVAFRD
ncbi:MAG: MFS transporter [Kiritimatiellales bacterium]|jgi:predicted MFS family arabinose efflux permease